VSRGPAKKNSKKTKYLISIEKDSGENILGAFHTSGVCILVVRSAKTVVEIRTPRNQLLPQAAEQKNISRCGSFSPTLRFHYLAKVLRLPEKLLLSRFTHMPQYVPISHRTSLVKIITYIIVFDSYNLNYKL